MKGEQCANMVASGGKQCHLHKMQTSTVITTTAVSTSGSTQCMAITSKGVPCKKIVAAGKGRLCSCHIGMASKISPVLVPAVRRVAVEGAASTRCIGITKKDDQCCNMIAAGKGRLCHVHAVVPVAGTVVCVASPGTSTQCMGTTLKGKPCTKVVAAGKGQLCSVHKAK